MSKKWGFIKWYRAALENPLFLRKPWDDWHAFEFLNLCCRLHPKDLVLADGTVMHIDTSQVFISRPVFAEWAGWSVKKLRAWEKRVNALKMVTVKGTPWGMVYTVENFEFHQLEGHAKGHAKGQTEGTTGGHHNNNDKECIKKGVRLSDEKAPAGPDKKFIPMPDEIKEKMNKIVKEV